MIKNGYGKWILAAILVASALLRLINLSSGDTLSDEVGYGFRAVGMLDFDEAGEQTTPLEWFDPYVPSWASLSFHDHPPLVFYVQYVSMQIFGETNLGLRLPSAIFGIASVYLLYLIGTLLYSETAGLATSALLGATVNHVAISRLGLQESYVILFILLATYFFIRALKKDIYLLWTGIALGLGFLTKYNVFILVPVFFIYLILYKREYFLNKKLWIGALLSLLILSPVLIYNYKLYQAVGHFDFQLSFILHQQHKEWQVEPGKEEFPTLAARTKSFVPNLFNFNSWLFLALTAVSLAAFLILLKNHPLEKIKRHALLMLSILWLLLLIIGAIGPSLRFLSILTPFLALVAGVFVASALAWAAAHKKESWVIGVFALMIAFEVFYSINSEVINYPIGKSPWLWSRTRYENYNWGYNDLGKWVTQLLDGKMPAFAFEPKYKFLATIQQQTLDEDNNHNLEKAPWLIVYDRNIESSAQLWNLDRVQVYHGWPIIPTETYVDFLQKEGSDYFAKAGIQKTYFIIPTGIMPLKKPQNLSIIGQAFEQQLKARGLTPTTIIKNKRGEAAFRVYEF